VAIGLLTVRGKAWLAIELRMQLVKDDNQSEEKVRASDTDPRPVESRLRWRGHGYNGLQPNGSRA
jgi:hypothetical protein